MTEKANGSVVSHNVILPFLHIVRRIASVHWVGHSFLLKHSLHKFSITSTTSSLPSLINSAETLSSPGAFPLFKAFIASSSSDLCI